MLNDVKQLVEGKGGILIHFDTEKNIALWKDVSKSEYAVNTVVNNDEVLSLVDGSYNNNIEDAMLNYLVRKGKKLSISIGISENDYDDIRDCYVHEWEYSDKSGIIVEVKVMNDILWNEEEGN